MLLEEVTCFRTLADLATCISGGWPELPRSPPTPRWAAVEWVSLREQVPPPRQLVGTRRPLEGLAKLKALSYTAPGHVIESRCRHLHTAGGNPKPAGCVCAPPALVSYSNQVRHLAGLGGGADPARVACLRALCHPLATVYRATQNAPSCCLRDMVLSLCIMD